MRANGLVRVLWAAFACLAIGLPARAQDDYQARREAMVDRLVADEVLTDARVIAAMREVPRHLFVPEGQRASAYENHPLPIGFGQTISAPDIVAVMTAALQPRATDRVLEIGTGSGYHTALLSRLVRHVYSIGIIEQLAVAAAQRLKDLGYTNTTVKAADGYLGWQEQAPFDRIIVSCAPNEVPPALVEQLKDGGLMVIPIAQKG